VRKLLETGGKTSKKIRGWSTFHSYRVGIVPIPTKLTGIPHDSKGIG
jgi:hypothetical protein